MEQTEFIESVNDLEWREIPAYNLDALKAKLEKLGRKADKLGVARPVLIEGRERALIDPDWTERHPAASVAEIALAPRIPMIWVLVLGPVIKKQGWQFHAQIEHTEHGNLIKSGDASETELVEYRHCAPDCDHCKIKRYRKHTYIVKKVVTE